MAELGTHLGAFKEGYARARVLSSFKVYREHNLLVKLRPRDIAVL